jgi:carbon-monoxide dehydrogenase medium subunit
MWSEYITAGSVEDVIRLLGAKGPKARIIAGATDLILELERGVRTGIETIIDITRIPGLDQITEDEDGIIHLGPLVSHNQVAASSLLREKAYPLARASWEVGAPQIRNRATVAGNLITASPANDAITPLMAMDAWLVLRSLHGERIVKLQEFYKGVRKTVLEPGEMVVDIAFKGLTANQRGTFVKVALRRAQAISVVNLSIVLTMDADVVEKAIITLGAVAPTIIHATQAEIYLSGKKLSDDVISTTADLSKSAATPIDDIRGTADYRREMVRVFTMRALRSLITNQERSGMPDDPVTLMAPARLWNGSALGSFNHVDGTPINTKINGKEFTFTTGSEKTLLRFIREEAGLTGTKEGCAEGECGACTVFLDGTAVMACMVPAPRAHNAEITTVEGLANGEQLHPVQEAFIQDGAVQCGYCSPGFLMSAAKLLEEQPHPTRNQIEEAITGNLCRCTGYYKIVQAIEDASLAQEV